MMEIYKNASVAAGATPDWHANVESLSQAHGQIRGFVSAFLDPHGEPSLMILSDQLLPSIFPYLFLIRLGLDSLR